jgi:hypothetical protein
MAFRKENVNLKMAKKYPRAGFCTGVYVLTIKKKSAATAGTAACAAAATAATERLG